MASHKTSSSIQAQSRRILPSNLDDAQTPLLRPSSQEQDDESTSRWAQWCTKTQDFWLQSKGMILVLLSQFFGASMNVMTQYLEVDGERGAGMDPFQILFVRMSITVIASYLYMWYAQVPDPLGRRPVIGLLTLRAVGGFFGVFGLYYSVKYLPLSEATVLTFLAPILSCYATSLFAPHETFTWKQQLAGVVSLGGVVLIARPFSPMNAPSDSPSDGAQTDELHHLLAILMALVGVLGAACAYTTIRMIGKRTHPLVSVTYFSVYSTLISCIAMAVLPSVDFKLPSTSSEWTLLFALGVCGFLLQFLLTAGLAYVPPGQAAGSGNRATSMVYTQMLFALFYDKVVWGNTLSAMSWAGSGLILVSAIYVAMAREPRGDAVQVQVQHADERNEGGEGHSV
ncbi:DMT family transporter [Aspergillus glaucus CBS 516.65]|uniref:EamA domain-containing protein n=1 Tax=Aspergillus glaucus CBS 516.65 TaxID=1160497 RepID=A0A1L9VHK1_ASPGL|nr:hypothetical protein ASPGLDRAFT_67028 [Aspergillus glaucus CBS 516.65]OJJ83352.1 hypothetical protein ASPGLDRAFT_67028 [Aspergillus glaucus CBS 516.65]